jgi:hypothetical protein
MKTKDRQNPDGSPLKKYAKYAHVLQKTKWAREFSR